MSETVALVTGATGHQGGGTARELLKNGIKVHILVRNPSSKSALELQRQGAHVFQGDFDNTSSIKAAMDGTTAVFLNVSPVPSEPEREVIHAKNIIDAARASETVNHLVYPSVTMTGKHESFPNWGPGYPMTWYWENKARIETMVRESGVAYWTILRPAFLMNNYHRPTADFMFPDLVARGVFRTAYKPSTAMTVLDPDDVGKFAGAAIMDPLAFNRHEIDLGVECLTISEIAKEMGQVSGKEIGLEFYSEEEAREIAVKDPRVRAQLWANEVGYQVDFKQLAKYPITLTRFGDYLDKHRDEVLRTFS